MRGKIGLTILLGALVTAPGWAAQKPAGAAAQPQKAVSDPANSSTGTNPDPNYIIGPMDDLSVKVWNNAQLSQDVAVRPDGKISLPLIDDVQAAGLTPLQLSDQIRDKLKKYDTNPVVTVIVKQINSRRIYIMGEVRAAGAYMLMPGMTVLQALSTAGGFTQFAKTSKIYVLRTENGTQKRYWFNYKRVVSGKAPQENIALKPGDTVVVPE